MKIRSRWASRCAAWVAVTAGRLLFRTCRIIEIAPEDRLRLQHRAGPDDPERFLLSVWHDPLLIAAFVARHAQRDRACCLVSQHMDGGVLADALALMHYGAVRGSSSRGGAQALKQLITETEGRHIIITPDGPRGPRHELKLGLIFLASQTGRRICASAFVCRRAWKVRGSWTDMIIPKPFTTIYALTSEPIAVPPECSREQLDEYRLRVQNEMERLLAEGERLAAGSAAPPDQPQTGWIPRAA